MPITKLKVDRSFISGLPDNQHDLALTRTILAMADALHLSTIAEGVENSSQLELLRNAGCHYVQGFLLSSPVAAQDMLALRAQTLV